MYGVGFLFLLESPRTINRIFLLRFIKLVYSGTYSLFRRYKQLLAIFLF